MVCPNSGFRYHLDIGIVYGVPEEIERKRSASLEDDRVGEWTGDGRKDSNKNCIVQPDTRTPLFLARLLYYIYTILSLFVLHQERYRYFYVSEEKGTQAIR